MCSSLFKRSEVNRMDDCIRRTDIISRLNKTLNDCKRCKNEDTIFAYTLQGVIKTIKEIPPVDQKQPCIFCLNARSDPKHKLTDDNDYGAIHIGSMPKGIIAHLISGDHLPVRIEIMQWNEKHQQNEPIFRYAPNFCPECGRDLRNDYKDSRGG